jgi:hypothetical protein
MAGMTALFLRLFVQGTMRSQPVRGFQPRKTRQNQRFGAANGKSLLDLNIA